MPLTTGLRLGPYEIVSPIGRGGMGEVYLARDTRLGREVAIKILPESVARDPDRLARFEREAKVLAALNHPNVAQIYGVEESSGVVALVMEFVPGQTLDEMLRAVAIPDAGTSGRRAISTEEAIAIARQIADALDAAHEAGIVHRDLKPANIKRRDDGTVKVLDFGLAKTSGAIAENSPGQTPDDSPTMLSPARTTQGLILGTAAYMSPEQARGKTVDKRADIWAFGVVLHELLTGRRLFDGETVSDTIAAVLTRPIDVDALPDDVPPHVRSLVARCLERDPKRRLRDIGEARLALEIATPLPIGAAPQPRTSDVRQPATTPATERASTAPVLIWAAVVLIAMLAATYAIVMRRSSPVAAPSVELDLAAPAGTTLQIGANLGSAQVSPDGTRIAFVARNEKGTAIWVRSVERDDARPLAGTTGGLYPFWAPDSRRLGFFAAGRLWTVDTAGGLPESIADAVYGRGGSWSDRDEILFTPSGGGGVHRVAARGGSASPVTSLDLGRAENAHYWPVALPGGRLFLYFVRSSQAANNGIYLGSIDGSRPAERLVTSLASAIYAPPIDRGPGHLLWVRDAELMAQPFDASAGTLSGTPEVVAADVRVMESQLATLASVSSTGLLVLARASTGVRQFAWYGRDGRRGDALPIDPGFVLQPRISPDAKRLLFTRSTSAASDIWGFDFATGVTSRVTPTAEYEELPDWAPDSRSLVYFSLREGRHRAMLTTFDGSVPPRELAIDVLVGGARFSQTGRFVLFTRRGSGSDTDVWVAPVDAPDRAVAVTGPPANEIGLSFSPDGRWIVFLSDRSGTPGVNAARLITDAAGMRIGQPVALTTGGATAGVWRRDGQEIILESLDERLLSVPVRVSGDTLVPEPAVPLFALPPTFSGFGNGWTMLPDASKFIVAETPGADGQTFRVVSHWQSRLARTR